jgi:hypothetical protein
MEKKKVSLSVLPIILLGNFLSIFNKAFAIGEAQTKYGMPQPLYGIPPINDIQIKYGPMPDPTYVVQGVPLFFKIMAYVVVPILVLILIILGVIKIIKRNSKKKGKA